jgi:hypothetical protein
MAESVILDRVESLVIEDVIEIADEGPGIRKGCPRFLRRRIRRASSGSRLGRFARRKAGARLWLRATAPSTLRPPRRWSRIPFELSHSYSHVRLVLNVTGRAGGFGAGEMKRVKGGRELCTLHGFLSHSGFRSVSDPTSQPHVTAVDRSAARYTCYAQRNAQPDRPLRMSGSWRRNQPRDHPGNDPATGSRNRRRPISCLALPT